MKKLVFSLIMPVLACCSFLLVSCNLFGDGGDDDSSNCFTRPTNVLILSDGIAYNWEYGEDVHYFYDKMFTLSEYNKMSDDEIVAEVVTGIIDDRTTPDANNYGCYYHLQPNQEYVYVTVSYEKSGKVGETVVTHWRTKGVTSQPIAEIIDVDYYEDDVTTYYGWDVKKNTYCKEYYTYAVASRDYFYTYYWAEEETTALYAWAIREEIKKNPEEHDTRINELSYGSEKLFASQVGDGVSYLPANPYYDNYLQIVTWGADKVGELSGVLHCLLFDLTDSNSVSELREAFNAKQSSAVKQSSTVKTPKSVVVNRNDIEVFRIR